MTQLKDNPCSPRVSGIETNRIKPIRLNVDVFTTGAVGRLLGVSPRKVAMWCDTGALRCYRIPGGNDRRIRRQDLIAFSQDYKLPLTLPTPVQLSLLGVSDLLADDLGWALIRVRSLLDLGLTLDRKADRHVVVIDLASVGRGEGMAAARRLRSEFPVSRLTLIALACEDEAAALSLMEAGFNTVLLSPVAPKVLREAIGAAMGEG